MTFRIYTKDTHTLRQTERGKREREPAQAEKNRSEVAEREGERERGREI
jgi:hypothetical protein